METVAKILLVFGLSSTVSSLLSTSSPWSEMEITAMALVSTGYYNKASQEDAVYKLFDNESEYLDVHDSNSTRFQFLIKETLCQKSETQISEECDFKENGMIKLCTAAFFPEDDLPTVVVTCENVQQNHTRVRRSRSGRGGRNGGGRGGNSRSGRSGGSRGRGGKTGSRSSIAGRDNGSRSRLA